MAIGAAIATVVGGAVVNLGISAATQPNLGDPVKQSRETVLAVLRALPQQRRVEAAARLGIPIEYVTQGEGPGEYQMMDAQEAVAQGFVTQEEADRSRTGQVRVLVPASRTLTADFTGYGDADTQGQLARAMAEIQLDLQRKYGADFIQEARAQQELADPEGVAARRRLAGEINRMEDERESRVRPVASGLDAQILEELQGGRGVGADASGLVASSLAHRRDSNLRPEDILAELESGPEGDARLRERLQKAMGYLSSGSTAKDLEYRDRQQGMANMAAFLAGRTPQSQFGANRQAQQGAAPTPQGSPLPNVPGNLTQTGQNAALQNYAQGVQRVANNVNPWFAGLTLLTQGAATAGAAGWQPFGQNQTQAPRTN